MTFEYLRFGQYLKNKGLITNKDVRDARLLQMQHNNKFIHIAEKKRLAYERGRRPDILASGRDNKGIR
jgi:hypothetical protein